MANRHLRFKFFYFLKNIYISILKDNNTLSSCRLLIHLLHITKDILFPYTEELNLRFLVHPFVLVVEATVRTTHYLVLVYGKRMNSNYGKPFMERDSSKSIRSQSPRFDHFSIINYAIITNNKNGTQPFKSDRYYKIHSFMIHLPNLFFFWPWLCFQFTSSSKETRLLKYKSFIFILFYGFVL